MTLDVRRLRLLREVALRGTISAAAEALSFTASAVSQQLTTLEREAGAELLERNGRGVRLTDAGSMLVSRAESILAELERAESDLEELRTTVAGRIRVAAFPSVTAAVLAPAFAALAERHPGLTVTHSELEPEHALREVKLGELDLVVAHEYEHMLQPPDPTLERTDLFVEDMLWAVPQGLVPAGQPLALTDLCDEPWIAAPPWSECGRAEREACLQVGFEPDVRCFSNEFGVMLALVGAGLGVSLLPALAFPAPPAAGQAGQAGWEVHRMAGQVLRRRVFAAHRGGSRERPSLLALLEAIRAAACAHAAAQAARW
jgi:molybdate transport repressor ModE-like protein